MGGCFGNSPYDRYSEAQLYRYLDECDKQSEKCESGDCSGCDEDCDERSLPEDKEGYDAGEDYVHGIIKGEQDGKFD